LDGIPKRWPRISNTRFLWSDGSVCFAAAVFPPTPLRPNFSLQLLEPVSDQHDLRWRSWQLAYEVERLVIGRDGVRRMILLGRVPTRVEQRLLAENLESRASGELQVRDGQYLALARKLDIERGRLIFNGGLLVDPAVDIRAVKVFPDVKAGVNVRGTLRDPRLSFFSEPSIPQSDIVQILLAGSSFNASSGNSTNTNGSQEVAGQAAAILASQLGNRLGIPDISVESDLTNDTSLVLGRYLSPRLFLSYGISLTESISTIKMRYTLNDHWTIRTEAGKERAADLVFTIEK